MSNVDDLTKLNREQLNQLASQNGVEDASDEEKYPTKASLAEAVAPNVTPEKLQEFKSGGSSDSEDSEQTQGSEEVEQPAENQDPATQVGGGPTRTHPVETGADFSDAVEDAEAEDDDPSKTDEDEDEEPALTENPNLTTEKVPQSEEGFGWPRKGGKTQDIFGDGDYTHTKYVGGHVVPLSEKNFNEKSDSDILKQVDKVRNS